MKFDGTLYKYEAVLVANGFTQLKEIDTFAHVAKITSTQLIIALAIIHTQVIYKMGVKTTILNEILDEKVHMKQLEGLVVLCQQDKVISFLNIFLD